MAGILAATVVSERLWPEELERKKNMAGGLEARTWVRPDDWNTASGVEAVLKRLAVSDGPVSRTSSALFPE